MSRGSITFRPLLKGDPSGEIPLLQPTGVPPHRSSSLLVHLKMYQTVHHLNFTRRYHIRFPRRPTIATGRPHPPPRSQRSGHWGGGTTDGGPPPIPIGESGTIGFLLHNTDQARTDTSRLSCSCISVGWLPSGGKACVLEAQLGPFSSPTGSYGIGYINIVNQC